MRLISILSVLAATAVSAHEETADISVPIPGSDVVILTDDTFDAFVAGITGVSLIEFYAPWCGHCKSLSPEYEIAAKALKADKVSLAKVDCTVEKKVCEKLGIQGFPTLKIFRDGSDVPAEYKGPRVAPGIISFMKKQSTPAITVLTAATLDTFSKSDEVVVIGSFVKVTSDEFKAFEATANKLRDSFAFGYVIAAADSVVLYKKFDDGKATLTGPITAEAITAFVNAESVPLVAEIGPDNYAQYVERGIPIGYFFYETASQKEKYSKAVVALATEFKGKASIVYIDAVKYAGHGSSMNLLVYPGFVIASSKAGTKFPYSGELTEKGLSAHVAGVLDGTILPSLKSAAEPVPNDEPVLIVVNKSFNDVVNNKSKDVFIELYAPWCGHCKKLSPIWDTLATQLGKTSNFIISKMDMTENDLPLDAGYTVEGFPTLKLYKANTNEIVDYAGDRSLPDLVKFLKENAVHGSEIKEHVGIDAADESEEAHSEEL